MTPANSLKPMGSAAHSSASLQGVQPASIAAALMKLVDQSPHGGLSRHASVVRPPSLICDCFFPEQCNDNLGGQAGAALNGSLNAQHVLPPTDGMGSKVSISVSTQA